MSWDAIQREALAELGLRIWMPHVPGSEPPAPADPRVLAMLAKASGLSPQALDEAGIALPGIAQTAFFGLPGQIRDPAQGDAVIGDAAGIGFVVGKAAFPAGRERMGQSEIVAHMPSCMAVE